MTEPTDPTKPGDADDRAWFRAQVGPVVEAEPVADAWHLIEGRTAGDSPAPAPIVSGRPQRTRWIAAAAVLLVLAGATVVVALRGDDADSVTAGQPEVTGWYLPKGLPEGWTLVAARVIDGPTTCTQLERSWSESRMVDPGRSLTLAFDVCGTTRPGGQPVDPSIIGDAVQLAAADEIRSMPGSTELRWQTDDGAWKLRLTGLDSPDGRRAQLEEAARRVMDNPLDFRAPLADLVETDYRYTPGIGTGPIVAVQLRAPSTRTSPDDGHLVTYRLAAPGSGPAEDPFSVTEPVDPAQLPGQPLPVMLRTANWTADEPGLGTVARTRYLGSWPGADIDVPRWSGGPTSADDADPEDAAAALKFDTALAKIESGTVAASLRPATTDEWRAFLATSETPADQRLTSATNLADALRSPAEAGGTTTTQADTGGTSTTQPEATTTSTVTTEEPDGDGLTSPVAAEITNDVPSEDDSELRGLQVRMRIDRDQLAAGDQLAITLLVENTTDEPIELGECTVLNIRWGLLPDDDPGAALPEASGDHCTSLPVHTVDGGQTLSISRELGRPSGFVAQTPDPDGSGRFLGTLPAGAYQATLRIPGRSFDAVLSIPVAVSQPACPTTNSEIQAYLSIEEAEARAVAEEQGRSVRVVRVDGVPQARTDDLRCNRINLDVDRGLVTNAVAY